MSNPLTSQDILLLLEMCLDAEDRCAERAAAYWQRGDHAGAERERELQARYASLRYSIIGQTAAPASRGPAIPLYPDTADAAGQRGYPARRRAAQAVRPAGG